MSEQSQHQKPPQLHPNPFTLAPLSHDDAPIYPPISAAEVAEIREKANVAHRRQDVKIAKDRAQYFRNQKGHSLLLHLFVIGPFTLWIPALYYTASPNHYWHA